MPRGRPKKITSKSEIVRSVPTNDAADLVTFLRDHTRSIGSFRIAYNPQKLSEKSPSEFFGEKSAEADLDAGVYQLTWYPRGTLGGLVSCVSNTLSGLKERAAVDMDIEIDKTGEQNGK